MCLTATAGLPPRKGVGRGVSAGGERGGSNRFPAAAAPPSEVGPALPCDVPPVEHPQRCAKKSQEICHKDDRREHGINWWNLE